MLKLDSLTITYLYGATGAKEVSLECKNGERIAVLAGEEGGKTSLLKCIAGLYPATGGKIYVEGVDITSKKIKERNIMLVHSDGGIIKTRTVRANLELPLKVRKYPKEERQKTVVAAAKEYGLYPALGDFAYRLQDDDRLRLAVARTAVRQSPVVMFDDVFAMVPSCQRKPMLVELLPKIRALRDTAVLFATTSLEEALSVGDKMLVMHYGIVEQYGSPKDVIDCPATLNTDKIVNPYKNRLAVKVTDLGDGRYIYIFNKPYRVPCPASFAGREVVCSFGARATDGGRLPISDYFYYGDSLYVKCGGIIAKAEGYPASKYDIAVDIESIRLFDATSEKALTF